MSRTVAEHIALDASAILTLTDNEPGADLALPRHAGDYRRHGPAPLPRFPSYFLLVASKPPSYS